MILLVHPTAALYGSDRVFLESATALQDAGHRVVVSLAESGPLEDELRKRGVHVEVSPSPVLRKSMFTPRGFIAAVGETLRDSTKEWRLIRQVNPDLIYVNTITIPLWNILAKLHRVPLLVHVHEGEASTGSMTRKVLALPLFAADIIIANSKFSAGVVTGSFKRLGRKIQVVNNAVPGPAEPGPVRTEIPGPLRLAYIGRLSPRKGVDVAVDALALLRERGVDAELDLIGAVYAGYEWYEQQLHEQVSAKSLDGKVRFHGFQPDIWPLMAESDIVLVPSRADEPFGNTSVEAILGGRPVIASKTTGLREATAGYGAAMQVRAGDPAQLAMAVETIVANWDGMQELLTQDLFLARQRHGIEAYGQHLVSIVNSITSPDDSRVFGTSKD